MRLGTSSRHQFDAGRRGSRRPAPSVQAGERLALVAILALGLLVLVGCQSASQPGGASHASVQIKGHSLAEVQQTLIAVFGEKRYALAASSPGEMVFQRPGSRSDALKWGGWSGSGVTMRVKVRLSQTGGNHLLQADAYAVQNSDDPFFQTESRNITLNRVPYQKLLNEVAGRLK